MILKAIFCSAFLQFLWNAIFIVNLLTKTDSIVICVPCMFEHVYYEPFFLKICTRDLI